MLTYLPFRNVITRVAEVHYYMVQLHSILNLICKFAITLKNDAFVPNEANTRLTKNFVTRLPTSTTLVSTHIQVFVTKRAVYYIVLNEIFKMYLQ